MMNQLTIYFTSDTHGYLYNSDFTDDRPRPMGLLSMRFPKDGSTLVIDGGDTIQGSPLTWFCHETQRHCPAAAALNDRGYDYVTLGNHDFNYGPAWLQSYLTDLNAQCLCANVRDAQGRFPLLPYTVRVMESGLKLGVFGIVTDWINLWEKPENLAGITVSDPLEAAKDAVRALRAEGVDRIVCIYHGGVEKDPDTGAVLSETSENIACRIAEALPIDLMLTGHQHIGLAEKQWAGTHIVQTPCNARQYARVTLDEMGNWHSELFGVPEQQARTAEEEALWAELQTFLDRSAGRLSRPLRPLDKLRMARDGSDIADFFNTVQLWASRADLSCAALANEVRGFDEHVTFRDVIASYPYANTLTVLEIDGRTLRMALEQCARYFARDEQGGLRISDEFLKPKQAHYNYDYFAGLDYTFDVSRPLGQRVVRMERNGKPIRDDDRFSLCMCSYRATGTGHFDFYRGLKKLRDIQIEISELIFDYFLTHEYVDLPESHPIRVIGA